MLNSPKISYGVYFRTNGVFYSPCYYLGQLLPGPVVWLTGGSHTAAPAWWLGGLGACGGCSALIYSYPSIRRLLQRDRRALVFCVFSSCFCWQPTSASSFIHPSIPNVICFDEHSNSTYTQKRERYSYTCTHMVRMYI